MEQDKRIAFALDQLKGRLHTATGDKRCGCEQCRYWVAMAARAAGVSRQRLESHLPQAAKPERSQRIPRPMTARSANQDRASHFCSADSTTRSEAPALAGTDTSRSATADNTAQ